MRYAVINERGEVENAILAEPDFVIEGKSLVATDNAGPGWTYEPATGFAPPADPEQPSGGPKVPLAVTRRQFMLALYASNLLEQADALVANHPYPPVKIEWQNATTFDRSNAALLALAMEMGATDEEVDALFVLAATYN